jgi:tRNA A37 threonylcarbamoyltransferase TsaD
MDPLVISAFVEAVQRGLEARTAVTREVDVIRLPANPGLFYATRAGATAGEQKSAAL